MSIANELRGWYASRETLWPTLSALRDVYRAHHPAVVDARTLGEEVTARRVTPAQASAELRDRTLGHGLSRPLRSRPGASYMQVVDQPEGRVFLRPVDAEWHASTSGAEALSEFAGTYVTITDSTGTPSGARAVLESVAAKVDESGHYLTFDLVSLRDLELIACHGIEPW